MGQDNFSSLAGHGSKCPEDDLAVVLENGNKNGNKLALGVDHTLDRIFLVNRVSKMVKVWG